jgi:hypothetical protein
MIERQRAATHPSDEAMVAWLAGLDRADEVAGHIECCPECSARIARRQDELETVEAVLRSTPDVLFPEASLARQREDVMRRIRGEARARVLRFPAASMAPGRQPGRLGATARWVAAAAVIGLLVGGSAMRLLDPLLRQSQTARTTHTPRPAEGASTPRLVNVSTGAETGGADEAFLVELDAAVVARAPEPLRVLDALTPERDPARRPR